MRDANLQFQPVGQQLQVFLEQVLRGAIAAAANSKKAVTEVPRLSKHLAGKPIRQVAFLKSSFFGRSGIPNSRSA
jgi:hypothetical protein